MYVSMLSQLVSVVYVGLVCCGRTDYVEGRSTSTEDGSVFNGCEDNDHCVCKIEGESVGYYALQTRLASLESQIQGLDSHQLYTEMVDLSAQIKQLQKEVKLQSLMSDTMTKVSAIERSAEELSVKIKALMTNGTATDQVTFLKSGLEDLSNEIHQLWPSSDNVTMENLQAQIQELENRLREAPTQSGDKFVFRGDTLPIDPPFDPDWCEHHELEGLDEPVTHAWRKGHDKGRWFKDPLPQADHNRTHIFYRSYSESTTDPYYGSSNYVDFLQSNKWQFYVIAPPSSTRNSRYDYGRTSTSVSQEKGLGYVLYKESIYAPISSDKVKKYRIGSNDTRISSQIQAAHINYMNQSIDTYIDLHADEKGLWAVYADSQKSNMVVVSRLDPEYLYVVKTYKINKKKEQMCLTFMVCGRLYTLDVCNSAKKPKNPFLQYTYDTVQDKDEYMRLHITSKYGQLAQLTYNPREQLIFGWDNGHLVTYNIRWKFK